MKSLPAYLSIATVAVLLLLAVAASVVDSLPFALIASYVVGFAASIQVLAMFLFDYGPRSPRLAAVVIEEPEAEVETSPGEPLPDTLLSTLGLRDNPATLSLL